MTEDAAHLKLNGSLCKQTLKQTTQFPYTWPFPASAMIDRLDYGPDLCEDQWSEGMWTTFTTVQTVVTCNLTSKPP